MVFKKQQNENDMNKNMKHNGVQIYITWDEYSAIQGAIGEYENNCEGSDFDYINGIQKDLKALRNVVRKFKNAKCHKDNKK